MEVGEFAIENTNETTRGNYFVCRIMKVTSVKVIKYVCITHIPYINNKLASYCYYFEKFDST